MGSQNSKQLKYRANDEPKTDDWPILQYQDIVKG